MKILKNNKYFILLFILAVLTFIGYKTKYQTNAKKLEITIDEKEVDKSKVEYNEEIEEITTIDVIKNSGKKNVTTTGKLVIPATNTNLPISIGTSEINLTQGVGTLKPNQIMGGENNYVLIGHNMNRRGVLLSDMKKVKINDQIILENKDAIYTYIAKEIKVINKKEGQIIDDTSNKKEVTIITCSPDGRKVTNNRLYVKGVLSFYKEK